MSSNGAETSNLVEPRENELLPTAVAQVIEEVRDRIGQGEPVDTLALLQEFPLLEPRVRLIQELAHVEYNQRRAAGETVDVEEFCARFGRHKNELQRYFKAELLTENHLGKEQGAFTLWPLPGSTFGDYTLLTRLGKGIFSRVYLAEEGSLGDRFVALKVFKSESSEASTLGVLPHPNIVLVHSTQKDGPDGLSAVCMPYLGSATLQHVFARIRQQDALPTFGRQILEAVWDSSLPDELLPEFADQEKLLQQLGLLSRDENDRFYKPAADPVLENGTYVDGLFHIFAQLADALAFAHRSGVCHRDVKPANILMTPHGTPMLLDFNLATEEDVPASQIGGTLPYMASEHLHALAKRTSESVKKVDARSDIYSLGVILYQFLTKQFPYGPVPAYLPDDELIELLRKKQRNGPIPVRHLNPAVDTRQARIIERCLAYDPAKRFRSAAELANALRQSLTRTRRAARWMWRYKVTVAIAASLMFIAGASLGIGLGLREPYPVRQYHAAVDAEHHGDHTLAAEYCDKALHAEPHYIDALFLRGQARLHQGDYRKALEDFMQAAELSRDGHIEAALGYCNSCLGNYERGRDHYQQAMDQKFAPPEVVSNLGYCCMQLGYLDEAEKFLTEATESKPDLLPAWHTLAMVDLRRAGKRNYFPEKAVKCMDTAIALPCPKSAEFYYDAACVYATAAGFNHRLWNGKAIDCIKLAIQKGYDEERLRSDQMLTRLFEEPGPQLPAANRKADTKPSVPPTHRLADPVQQVPIHLVRATD